MNAAQEAVQARLARIEGQVRGVRRMVEEGRPCEDVLTQLIAIRSACREVAAAMVSQRAEECIGVFSAEEAKSSIARAVQLLSRVS